MTEDGFGTVGDMGYVDADDYLYLVDRRVDLIITGGANVFPAEVEAALIDHPKIADVVVIGLKDEVGRRARHHRARRSCRPTTFDEIKEYAKSRLSRTKCRRPSKSSMPSRAARRRRSIAAGCRGPGRVNP